MRYIQLKTFIQFITGFILGLTLTCMIWFHSESVKDMKIVIRKTYNFNPIHNSNHSRLEVQRTDSELYNRTVADEMFKEVRVLCWVMTNPVNHQTKAIHVKKTWGKRCNKLLFMSSETDLELGAVALPVNEGRDNLWDKTKSAFQYVYRNHYEDADWFLKADDDSYLIMENVRYLLSQYHHETSLYFGCRYMLNQTPQGYMAGGGYILSKKALSKLNEKILPNNNICRQDNDGSEDLEMGVCLVNSTIFVDTRDDHNQMRFFPLSVEEHFKPDRDPDFWYFKYLYYNVTQGSLDCCSDSVAGFHYISPKEMYSLDYYIYHVNPYGLEQHNDKKPSKLPLAEILRRSYEKSSSPNYNESEVIRDFGNYERFNR